MNLFESIKIAFNALASNKMRSLLTMLGIIIGISSVITIMALGQGGQSVIDEQFESFGSGRAALTMNWEEDYTEQDLINTEDLKAIEEAFSDEIRAIVPSSNGEGLIKYQNKDLRIRLTGASENYQEIDKIQLTQGRFVSREDILSQRPVVILEEKVAMNLFNRKDVVGEYINMNIEDNPVTIGIIGVFKEIETKMDALAGEQMGRAYIPISALNSITNRDEGIYNAQISFEENIDIDYVKGKIIQLVENRHNKESLYMIQTAQEELDMINNVTNIITLVIGAIAAISLLVGGIGVMNIMFVSVVERTREIGIRKALGANRKDILLQFLVESIMLSSFGGIIGTLLGFLFAYLISLIIQIPPKVSLNTIIIAWVFSAGVGIFFGIYPANKASKLDPIDALRHE